MKASIKKFAATLGLTLALGIGAQSTEAADINPFDFNVYSLSNIGTSVTPYGSDYQGIAASAGNAYFSGFSLNDLNATQVVPGYAFITGGDFSIQGSINNGGVEAAGHVNVTSASIFGNVTAGGNLTGTTGTIYGNVAITGNNTSSVTITGSTTTGISYTPSLNFSSINQYLTNYSAFIATQADTTTYTNNFGELVINLASGDNYVTIDAATLNNAWGVTINGASDSVLYINVDGTVVSLDSTNWVYNGLGAGDVLLNYGDATSLALTGGNTVNLLAPLADVNFAYGLLTGNLITGSLTGSGQVNLGSFDHNVIPEPSSALVLLGSTMLLAIRRRTRRRAV